MDIRHYFNIEIDKSDKCDKSDKSDKSVKCDKYDKSINVYTDGSAFNNGSKTKIQKGGIGVYFGDNCQNIQHISEKLFGKITNNIAELKACIKAITIIINNSDFDNRKIKIYTDSKYVIDSITKWSINWKKHEWQKYNIRKKKYDPIKNKELIIELYNYYNKYNIEFIYIKAHTNEPINKTSQEYKHWYGNKMADKLAVNASKLFFTN